MPQLIFRRRGCSTSKEKEGMEAWPDARIGRMQEQWSDETERIVSSQRLVSPVHSLFRHSRDGDQNFGQLSSRFSISKCVIASPVTFEIFLVLIKFRLASRKDHEFVTKIMGLDL